MSAIVFFLLTAAAACSGALFKPGAWYDTLNKPSWTPPRWAFPVVWTILYVMIGYAGWSLWQDTGWTAAMAAWAAQLVANAAWSWIFFGHRRIGLALVDLVLLWLAVAAFIVLAWPLSPTASMLFLPYLVWVSAAGALNYSVLRLNPRA